MKRTIVSILFSALTAGLSGYSADASLVHARATKPRNAPLPDGFPADVESLRGAWTRSTLTRTRLCMNGLWRCRPSLEGEPDNFVPDPTDSWAWGNIPEVWNAEGKHFSPHGTLSPWFKDRPADRARIRPDRVWYGRTFKMPADADGRRVALSFDMVASHAIVYLDGHRAGDVSFPGGEVDLTPFVKPGRTQTLAVDVTAYARGDNLIYNEAQRFTRVKKKVRFKGLTGDVWLDIAPKGTRVTDAWTETSVSRGEIRFVAEIADAAPGTEFRLTAEISTLGSKPVRDFKGTATVNGAGRITFSAPWKDAAKWDLHTPENRYLCRLSIANAAGDVLDDVIPFPFAFREVRIAGRDLLLNGTPVHLRTLYDPSPVSTGQAMSRESGLAACRHAAAYGFNAYIGGNYSFDAGDASYLQGILDACDETGMLYCFSLPHFKDFGDMRKPESQARYRKTTAAIMRLARRHPCVVMWATSHNITGYLAAGDPLLIDGLHEHDGNAVRRHNARLCRRIIGELDPTRPCYHHSSGNLDDFHTVNCYLNWAPIQERSDWLEHWSTKGVKPVFFVEWGLPHISSFSSFRGPLFIWRKPGYMSLWSSEYAAAYRNDAAYEATPEVRAALDAEEKLWKSPRAFRWHGLLLPCTSMTNNYSAIQARFVSDNWRSFRGWGMTAVLPWDQQGLFKRTRWKKPLPNPRWPEALKHPGYCPKTLSACWGDPAEYEPTFFGRAMKRWNRPLCAWIGGRDPGAASPNNTFTDKRHLFRPGEAVHKTLMAVNDTREPVSLVWKAVCGDFSADGKTAVPPGGQARIPISFPAPAKPGKHRLRAEFDFEGAERQCDAFALHVRMPKPCPRETVTLYDPVGDTSKHFTRLGIPYKPADLTPSLNVSTSSVRLVIGRNALTRDLFRKTVLPFASAGGRVLIFEQSKETLEDVGFRVQTLGLRHVYPRFREETLANVLVEPALRDWAGASTLVPAHYRHDDPEHYRNGTGSALWAGYRNTRVWRCGNRGAVATVIPEKPSIGDWCALTDGGFDLQYSPLLEWRLENRGKIVFCQMDVTARTQTDPAADDLTRRLVTFLAERPPHDTIANPHGMQAYASILFSPYGTWTIEHDPDKNAKRLYLITSGADLPKNFFEHVRNGATALLCGLNAEEVRRFCPVPIAVAETNRCHYTRIEKLPPELNGLSNADWAWHGAMDFAAFTDPAPDGNNAFRVVRHGKGRLVFWQVPPWKIDAANRPYLRSTKRRAETMYSRLKGNLGFRRAVNPEHFYADIPAAEDDPYRYFHW